jgi:hypothetical protein
MLCDVADGMDRSPADLARALGDIVGHREDLLSLFVKQQVIVAKVLPAHVPVEVLGLQVQGEYVGEEFPQRAGYFDHCVAAEIGWSFPKGFCSRRGIVFHCSVLLWIRFHQRLLNAASGA